MRALRSVAVLALASLLFTISAAAHPGIHAAPAFAVPAFPGVGVAGTSNEVLRSLPVTTGLRVVGHADPGGGFNADVVAHRGYAYLASWGNGASDGAFCPSRGVRVYSLFNLARPTRVATFANGTERGTPSLARTWTEKVIVRHVRTRWFSGNLAVVSIQRCTTGAFGGFGLWDVTDPRHPKRLALYETEVAGSHEIWLQPQGGKAYVYTAVIASETLTSPNGTSPGKADFRIIDVSDPRHPKEVGEWGAWRQLGDAPISQDADGVWRTRFVHSVIGRGTRAYLSYWDLGTVILDVSNPAAPRYVGKTTFAPTDEGNAHSAWIGRHGRLMIQTDEDFSPETDATGAVARSWGYPRFFDITNPAHPRQIATLKLTETTEVTTPPGKYSVHDPKIVGNRAFFSWYAEGVVVADISNPAAPRVIAHWIPPPAADPFGFFEPPDVKFANVWGVFPLSRRTILASDINSGLWVLHL
jgi:hypothetical protein